MNKDRIEQVNLQKAADASGIGGHTVVILRVGGTRWATFTYRALERLFKTYTATTLHLSYSLLFKCLLQTRGPYIIIWKIKNN